MEYDARLENWEQQQVTNKEFILLGRIYDDKKERFVDGEYIRTSGIKNRKLSPGDIVQTRNTKYLLGEKHVA